MKSCFTLLFAASLMASLNILSVNSSSIAEAYAVTSLFGTSIPVTLLTDTQLTPDPGMVKVIAGHPQYIDSASTTPKASLRVIEGKANIDAAW